MMKIGIILIMVVVLAGCSQRQVNREEWLSMTSHTFPNTTVDNVLKAGDRVLQLSDISDVTVSHSQEKFTAYRKFMIYAVFSATFGRYEFEMQAKQLGPNVETKLEMVRAFSNVFGPEIKQQWKWREAHDLYFSRMEALLYNKKWETCSEAENKAESGWFLEPLCMLVDDNVPENGVQLSLSGQEKLKEQIEFEKSTK